MSASVAMTEHMTPGGNTVAESMMPTSLSAISTVMLRVLPEEIEAVFLCHGIAGKPGIWHKMFQINFISQKYVAERLLPRITEGGSVTFISSMGGLGWQRMYADLQGLIEAEGWDGQEA